MFIDNTSLPLVITGVEAEPLTRPVRVTKEDMQDLESAYINTNSLVALSAAHANPKIIVSYRSRKTTYSATIVLRMSETKLLSQAGHILIAYVSYGMLMLETGNFTSHGWTMHGYAGFLASRRDSDIASIFGLASDTASKMIISPDTVRIQGQRYYKVYGPQEVIVQAAYEYLLTRCLRALGSYRSRDPLMAGRPSRETNHGGRPEHSTTVNSRALTLKEAITIAVSMYQGTTHRLSTGEMEARLLPQTRAKIADVSGTLLPASVRYLRKS